MIYLLKLIYYRWNKVINLRSWITLKTTTTPSSHINYSLIWSDCNRSVFK